MGLGSGIRKKPIQDRGFGSRGQKGTGPRIRNTAKKLRIRILSTADRPGKWGGLCWMIGCDSSGTGLEQDCDRIG
jgi:hypothetical protein